MEEYEKKKLHTNNTTNNQYTINENHRSTVNPTENSYAINMEYPHQNESNSSEPAYLPSNNNKKYDEKKDKTYYQQHEDGINTETENDDDDDDDDDDDIQIMEEIDDDEEDDDNNTCIDNDNETYVYAATPNTEKNQKEDRDNAIIQQQSKAPSTKNDYIKNSKDNTKNLINGVQLSETFTQEEKNPNGNIEEDDEFDWNEDPEIKLKRSRTAREKLKEKSNNTYCCWHYLTPLVQRSIIALVGSSIFIIISLCVHYLIPRATPEQQSDPNFRNISDNVQVWMWWACFMWTDAWVIAVVVHLVPSAVSLLVKIFSGSRSEKVKTRLIYYMSMKRYIILTLLGLTNWATFHVLRFNLFPSIQNQSYSITVAKVFGFIGVLTIFLFVQKFLMLIISLTFHCSAYEDRIEALKYSRSVLDALSKAEDKRFNPVCCPNAKLPGFELSDNHGDSSNNMAEGQRQPIAPGNSTREKVKNFGKKIKSYIITDNPELFGKIEEKDVDVTSKKYAKKVAKKLFYALAYPYGVPHHLYKPNGKIGGTKMLEKHHFRPFFKSDEEAEQAFNIFDKDGNGDISRKEFRDTVIGIYEERALLSECIKDTSQALGKVDIILFIIFLIIAIFVCMSTIFGVNLYQILLPLGTFIMGLSFMFSETVKVAFQSIMFLFVTHPYDIGDVVYIDDVRLTVFNMGISGTIFIRSDGQKMYAPTSVLMTKFIYNARRSGDMGESVLFSVDFRTPTDLIFTLRDRLDEWVSNHPRDFTSGFDVRISDIINVNKVVLSAWIPHKGNWQDGGKRLQRLNKFMFYLKDTLHELNIQYELPPQQYTTDSFYKGVQNTSLVSSAYKDDYKTTKLFKNSKMQGDVDN